MQLTKWQFTIQIKCDYQFDPVPFFSDCHIFSQKPFIFSAFFLEIARVFKVTKNYFSFMAVSGICTNAIMEKSFPKSVENSGRLNGKAMSKGTSEISAV